MAGTAKTWKEKVLSADTIWAQVEEALKQAGTELPKTPRRPDVRLILNNTGGMTQVFRNPAKHAGEKAEVIPATGDKTAVMVMITGDTLAAQYENARRLYETFNLGAEGLSSAFVQALIVDQAGGLVREAYGPAPFEGQASKLVDVEWTGSDASKTVIVPVKGAAAAFGARAAEQEKVFAARVHIAVQGTGTVAEIIEEADMVIAVASDWQTGKVSTRPIVASVAKEFYGAHYESLPVVTVNAEGLVEKIDLMNGKVLNIEAPADQSTVNVARLKIA